MPEYGRAVVTSLFQVTSILVSDLRDAAWPLTLRGCHVGTSGLYRAFTALL